MDRSKSWMVIALVCASFTFGEGGLTDIEVLSSQPTRCTYGYAFDMYGAHCAGLRLTKIPNLKSGVEILDFSDNKLRELTFETFSSYTGVKFLYLADNQIYLIDENAFQDLAYLQTLDLSRNVITELPNSIFRLTSLRKLYLGGNPLIHLTSTSLTIPKPIKAPLEYLDVSDCKIRELPNWGMLPQLIFYNISHNPLLSLEPVHFAQMCNLGKVELTESVEKIKICELKPVIWWFQRQRIYFQLEDYSRLNSKDFEDCPMDDVEFSLNITQHRCKAEYFQVQNIRTSRRTWLTIGGGLAGFLFGFILLLYIMHRYNVAQTKESKEIKKPPPDGDRNATAVLLNNVA